MLRANANWSGRLAHAHAAQIRHLNVVVHNLDAVRIGTQRLHELDSLWVHQCDKGGVKFFVSIPIWLENVRIDAERKPFHSEFLILVSGNECCVRQLFD
jgi:hypothetical protein